MQETWVQSMGHEDLLEKQMATYSSILAWETPWTERSLMGLSPWGHKRIGHDLVTKQQKQIFPEHSDYQKCYHLPAWQTSILLINYYMSGTGLSP